MAEDRKLDQSRDDLYVGGLRNVLRLGHPAIAAVGAAGWRRRVGLAYLPIPILIGFSRMYIGAHYLSDVVCAAILGTLCTLAVGHFLFLQIGKRQSKVEI